MSKQKTSIYVDGAVWREFRKVCIDKRVPPSTVLEGMIKQVLGGDEGVEPLSDQGPMEHQFTFHLSEKTVRKITEIARAEGYGHVMKYVKAIVLRAINAAIEIEKTKRPSPQVRASHGSD